MANEKKTRRLSAEEQRLWKKVIEHVEVTKTVPRAQFEIPVSLTKKPQRKTYEPVMPFQIGQNSKSIGLTQQQELATAKTPTDGSINMDKRKFQRLLKGKLEIDGTLDLHGLSAEHARLQLVHFVQSAHRSGSRLLLVITGKGSKSGYDEFNRPKIGILKQGVPEWLRSGALSGVVLQVTQAHNRHGGGGAYYVYLRRKR